MKLKLIVLWGLTSLCVTNALKASERDERLVRSCRANNPENIAILDYVIKKGSTILEFSNGSIKILMTERSRMMVISPSKKAVAMFEKEPTGTRLIATYQKTAQVEDAIIIAQSLLLNGGIPKKLSDTE